MSDNLYEPYQLVMTDRLDKCPRGSHRHSFFEFVYIAEGTGSQAINNQKFSYKQGDLFLLAPEDDHSFDIHTTSRLFFIRFNSMYIKPSDCSKSLIKQLETILRNITGQSGFFLKREGDKMIIQALMSSIINEHEERGFFYKELIEQYINTLLVIVSRNISMTMPEAMTDSSDQKIRDILNYIHRNISNPEKLKVDNIGSEYGISEAYLGRYFKRNTGDGLQDYIMRYKLKQVENRLLYTSMRISEIANEYGFADKSHLSKAFKKYAGINPAKFRKNNLENA